LPTDDTMMIRVDMGSVTDYYKPKEEDWCVMLTEKRSVLWSADGYEWKRPTNFQHDFFENDHRKFLSQWGSETHEGGCCSGDYLDGTEAWGQPFTMYWCRAPPPTPAPTPEPTPAPTPEPTPFVGVGRVVNLAFTVGGLEFSSLEADPALRSGFVAAVKESIASISNSIDEQDVDLELSSGSVIVKSRIIVFVSADDPVFQNLTASATSLATAVLQKVEAVPGISEIATGDVTVDASGVTVEFEANTEVQRFDEPAECCDGAYTPCGTTVALLADGAKLAEGNRIWLQASVHATFQVFCDGVKHFDEDSANMSGQMIDMPDGCVGASNVTLKCGGSCGGCQFEHGQLLGTSNSTAATKEVGDDDDFAFVLDTSVTPTACSALLGAALVAILQAM